MITKYLTGHHSERPLQDPAVYIHLYKSSTYTRKQTFMERLAAFIRRQVTTTRNK